MLSKNAVYESHGSGSGSGKKLRENVADLFLMGGISAKRARSLYADSQTSDPKEIAELAKVAEGSHAHRDLMRKLRKNKKWPDPFEAHIPVYNRKTCKTEMGKIEIMLPHELVQCMCKWNNHDEEFWKLDHLRHACVQHLQNASMELGIQDDKAIRKLGSCHTACHTAFPSPER